MRMLEIMHLARDNVEVVYKTTSQEINLLRNGRERE